MRCRARWNPGRSRSGREVADSRLRDSPQACSTSASACARESRRSPSRARSAPTRSQGERSHRLDAQVHPGMAFAREAFDERVADEQGRRDEDLLLERAPRRRARASAAIERADERRAASGGAPRPVVRGVVERKQRLVGCSGHRTPAILTHSEDRRRPGPIGGRLGTETGEPTCAPSPARKRLRVRRDESRRRPREPDAGNAAVGRSDEHADARRFRPTPSRDREPLPGSRKVYVDGPARACGCRFARSRSRRPAVPRGEAEIHPPLRVYDTSGSVHRSRAPRSICSAGCRSCAGRGSWRGASTTAPRPAERARPGSP